MSEDHLHLCYNLDLGSFLPIRLQCFLRHEMTFIDNGTLVACELEDPAECNVDDCSQPEEREDLDAPVYILAKIAQRIESPDSLDSAQSQDPATAEYSINLGEEGEMSATGAVLYMLDGRILPLMVGPLCDLVLKENSTSLANHLVLHPNEVFEKLQMTISGNNTSVHSETQHVVKRLYLMWRKITGSVSCEEVYFRFND